MSLPRSLTRLALALALTAVIPAAALAGGDIIPSKKIVRSFPVGTWCPLPISISFTPPVSSVIVYFDAQVYIDNGFGSLSWTGQQIDNVSVVTTAQVAANSGTASGQSCDDENISNCYGEFPVDEPPPSYLFFNRPGLTLAHLELFDSDPTARGWDMIHGGYFVNSLSPDFFRFTAPRVPEGCGDPTGGSLGLGPVSTPESIDAVATTSITVSGLTPGTSYDLGAWWNTKEANPGGNVILLTIRIERQDGTPIARKSWGGLKSGYKGVTTR